MYHNLIILKVNSLIHNHSLYIFHDKMLPNLNYIFTFSILPK